MYFFLCFNANSLHKSQNCEFFSTGLIKIKSDINSEEILMSSCYFSLN